MVGIRSFPLGARPIFKGKLLVLGTIYLRISQGTPIIMGLSTHKRNPYRSHTWRFSGLGVVPLLGSLEFFLIAEIWRYPGQQWSVRPGWSFSIGDDTRQLYIGIIASHYKDPVMNQAIHWNARKGSECCSGKVIQTKTPAATCQEMMGQAASTSRSWLMQWPRNGRIERWLWALYGPYRMLLDASGVSGANVKVRFWLFYSR